MAKQLVLAEKPSVAKDIARVLGANQKNKGFFESNKYLVTWALGHLVTLCDPEAYDMKYKTWVLEDLPLLPDPLKLEVIKESKHQYHTVSQLLKRSDVSEIVIATDAGREGELVARWILDKANIKKPLKRLWISSVTDKAIKDGFNQLKEGRLYDDLYEAAKARAEADWIVGINATRALTTKFNAQLSAGRVQTPTVFLVHEREEMIRTFQPVPYFTLTVEAQGVQFRYVSHKYQDGRIFDVSQKEILKNTFTNQRLNIAKVSKTHKKQAAPKLYDLTELQREASNRYNLSPKQTLSVLQKLYEHHKVLTYPRTDSRYISLDVAQTLKERLRAHVTTEYFPFVKEFLNRPLNKNLSMINDALVSDHHAIIVTEEAPDMYALNDLEQKIYTMVLKRLIANVMDLHEYEETKIEAKVNEHTFTAKGKIVAKLGFKALEQKSEEEDEEDDQSLPPLKQGDIWPINKVIVNDKKTEPPKLFTEATLLSAMENPSAVSKQLSSQEAKILKETKGLGTVATRADIIEKLFQTSLITLNGRSISTTSKGRQLLSLVPEDLKSPALTAYFEQQLALIEQGKSKRHAFTKEMRTYAQKVVNEIRGSDHHYRHDNMTAKTCPDCQKPLLEIKKKDMTFHACMDRECGYKTIVSRQSQARCPVCHKRMTVFGEGENQRFVCVCGHREKLEAFMKRRDESKQQMSSHQTRKVIEKVNKESKEVKNTALADQLKELFKK